MVLISQFYFNLVIILDFVIVSYWKAKAFSFVYYLYFDLEYLFLFWEISILLQVLSTFTWN